MTENPTLCATDTPGAEVDRNVSSMRGAVAMPRSNGELVFDEPWQSRAFGMAVSLSQAGFFDWDTFRGHLAAAIAEKGQNGVDEYYERWLDALERSLAGNEFLDGPLLHEREAEFRAHARDEVF
ncbi:nitrile hydratase accessory protein [Streptomyces sp. NPDC059255]|uniref:nitrile hydratase accessory protein n=1 Tax=Streptomyces sp. NPDC059255 TaxID=3346793 RepID=UPI0036BFDD07